MAWIINPANRAGKRELGGKAASLQALCAAGLPVPQWFAISPGAFTACIELPAGAGADETLRAVDQMTVSDAVREAIEGAVGTLAPKGELVAVRSSAIDEDGQENSFAGQLASFLFVRRSDVVQKVLAVWQSGFTERILTYRRERGLAVLPDPPAVVVQRMVPASRAGVCFSADPVSGRRGTAVVAAVYGLGTLLVSGEGDADTYHVDRHDQITHRAIARKVTAHEQDPSAPEGVTPVPVQPDMVERSALADDEIRNVAALAQAAERHFGRPQDIEWAYGPDGTLYLLQSRPITALTSMADPDGSPVLWDNSNIAESYGGITTPLTFSFARRAYAEVYRQFCGLMGVPQSTVDDHADLFRCMLGLVQGRVYYNLLNWYRALALLPGFRMNRTFMEQMMGVKESLPADIVAGFGSARFGDRLLDGLRLCRTICGLIVNHWRLRWKIRAFYVRLGDALGDRRPDLSRHRPDELLRYYRTLERSLLIRWDAPLINDFFAMIFYGLLRKLTVRWCDDQSGTLQNDLLCGEGGMVSAEPPRLIGELAGMVAHDAELTQLFSGAPWPDVLAALPSRPAVADRVEHYLERFGDRCMEELKLESPTLYDDPLVLIRSIGRLATVGIERFAAQNETQLRKEAEARVRHALRGRPLRRLLFNWVLRGARHRVRDRENLRFERTRVFGRVRQIFTELGKRYWALGLLNEPRDIFYLEVEEALGLVEGTATTNNVGALAALRRAEYDGYRADEAVPAERFETRGVISIGQQSRRSEATPTQSGEQLQGTGCCPGFVCGQVRVVTNPHEADIQPGEILVAERTDPGWVMLFAAASGLLVERGSLLSHSAIVSREMGIPSIVGLAGVTQWLNTGDWVELDGATGIVNRIPAPERGGSDGGADQQ